MMEQKEQKNLSDAQDFKESKSPSISDTLHHAGAADTLPRHFRPVTSLGVEQLAETAKAIIDSFYINDDGLACACVPSGVGDIQAMHALNALFRMDHPRFDRDAIFVPDFNWYQESSGVRDRRVDMPREIRIQPVVPGSTGENRASQLELLQSRGLVFAEPIEQALIAATYMCRHGGSADIFMGTWARGSVPGHALPCHRFRGVRVFQYDDSDESFILSASGRPI
jgi:hypothetical protein